MAHRPSWPAFPRPLFVAILVLLAGILINGIFYSAGVIDQQDRSADHFANDTAALVDVIDAAIHHGSDLVVAAQALFEASRTVTTSEFLVFVERLGPGEGVASIGFAPLVSTDDIDAFEAEMQRQVPGFDLYELDAAGNRTEVQPRAEHYLVTAELGFEDLPIVVGLDLASEPVQAAAIAESLATGEPVVSGFLNLPGDEQAGDVKIFAPARDPEGRLLGVVFSSIQIDELLDQVRDLRMDHPVTWQLADITEQGAAGTEPVREDTRWVDVLEVHGRYWVLTVETETDHLAYEAIRDRLMLLMGLIATLLATVLGYVIAKSRGARREFGRMRDLARAKDRFLAGVSHEIRTPLTSVLGMTEILSQSWRALPADEVQDLLDIVEDQGAEIADRVDDLLTIGNISTGTLSMREDRVDLGPEIDHATARVTVPPGKEVRQRGTQGIVIGDRLRIRQILRNLYSNALRYADRTVQIMIRSEGDRLQISVCNDGPPLDVEKQRRVFQAYVEDDRPGQPSTIGAGLWISRTLAEAMKGSLTYRYAEGRSVFTLELPAAEGAVASVAGSAAEEATVPGR